MANFTQQILANVRQVALEIVRRETTHMKWGTVTSISPLQVRYDGETTASIVPPQNISIGLQVGDRVQLAKQHGQATILGRASDPASPDIDWVNLPYTEGHTPGTAQQAQVALKNGVVYYRGGAQKTSGSYVNGETIIVPTGGLPEWARPAQNIRFGGGATGRRPAYLIVTSTGAVVACPDPANPMPTWITGTVAYPREN